MPDRHEVDCGPMLLNSVKRMSLASVICVLALKHSLILVHPIILPVGLTTCYVLEIFPL